MSRKVLISNRFDMLEAQRRTKGFARELGFSSRASDELALVASELSSNILKYATKGRIDLVAVDDPGGRGIAIKAHDQGPPFRNVDLAVLDGYDDTGPIHPDSLSGRGGLGSGLGAVVRLTHSFRVEHERTGKWVIATRYLGRPLLSLPRGCN